MAVSCLLCLVFFFSVKTDIDVLPLLLAPESPKMCTVFPIMHVLPCTSYP